MLVLWCSVKTFEKWWFGDLMICRMSQQSRLGIWGRLEDYFLSSFILTQTHILWDAVVWSKIILSLFYGLFHFCYWSFSLNVVNQKIKMICVQTRKKRTTYGRVIKVTGHDSLRWICSGESQSFSMHTHRENILFWWILKSWLFSALNRHISVFGGREAISK